MKEVKAPKVLKEMPPDLLDEKKDFNWYPGHMARAIREIKEKLKHVDIVLEIRDARAPLASGNRAMDEVFRQKSRLILLNKVNLADPRIISLWETWFKAQGQPFMFINCFDKSSLKKVMALARKIVDEKRGATKEKLKMMVIGLPNTGKSTIINQLANRTAAKTADRPGQTTGQQWINIDANLDLLDTPGVMPPELELEEHSLWLSAINAMPDSVIGEELPARFLVKHLLEIKSKEFLERYKLESFDLSIDEILNKIAVIRGCLKQKGLPDYDRVHKLILLDFRSGELGKCCFGLPPN
jgi:ribosome biogenesis GTPase A